MNRSRLGSVQRTYENGLTSSGAFPQGWTGSNVRSLRLPAPGRTREDAMRLGLAMKALLPADPIAIPPSRPMSTCLPDPCTAIFFARGTRK